MKEEIKVGDRLYGFIYQTKWEKGSTWLSNDEDNIQVGLFHYDKEKHLKKHRHIIYERIGTRTCETMYVVEGSLTLHIFDDDKKEIFIKNLYRGDIYVSLWGGHSFDILEDGTRIFEAKNGPYYGVEKDKIFYE
jgi:hypothetical protein